MELPFSLRTLPPEAIDILRYFGANGAASAHAEEITGGSGLTDRGFGKAIRRLVTKGMIVMDGDQVYRLSDSGRRGVAELLEYDLNTPADERPAREPVEIEARYVKRHVLLAAPSTLPVNAPAQIIVALDDAADDDLVMLPLHILVGVSMIHGEPTQATWQEIAIENRRVQYAVPVTAGAFTNARIRVQICQSEDDQFDESNCGGLVVDLPVGQSAGAYAAFATDVMLKDTSSDSFDYS